MANKRISELSSITEAAGGDLLAIVDISDLVTKNIEVSDLMASPGPIGLSNPDQAEFTSVTMVNTVNEFSIDATFVGNSDTAVPTEKAIKTYVDNAISNATDNVVRENYVYTDTDTTAAVGDVVFVDTTGGAVEITLMPGNSRILIIKTAGGLDQVKIIPSIGLIYEAGPLTEISMGVDGSSLEFLWDGSTYFYVI